MPNALDETIIHLSKKKLVLLLCLTFFFMALCCWLLSLNDLTWESLGRSVDFTHLILWVGLVLSVMCGFFLATKLFDPKPGLVLNSRGMTDNSSGVPGGFVPWSDVAEIDVCQVSRQKFVAVALKNPQEYLRSGNFFQRQIKRINLSLYGSPLFISPNALKINFNDLESLVNAYFQRYQNTLP